MPASATEDRKPSGLAYQPAVSLDAELRVAFKTMVSCVYHGLRPVNLLVVFLTLVLFASIGSLQSMVESPAEVLKDNSSVAGEMVDLELLRDANLTAISSSPTSLLPNFRTPLDTYNQYLEPWYGLGVHSNHSFGWRLLNVVLALLGWTWIATFLCRSTVVCLNGIPHRWLDTARFTSSHYWDALFSILIPLVVIGMFAIPLGMIGMLLSVEWLAVVGGPLTMLGVLIALPVGMLLIGLVLGWPLMFPAIAVEGRDSFESISRTYAYILQRPAQLLLFSLLALFVGSVMNLFLTYFLVLAENFYIAITSWGADRFQTGRYEQMLQVPNADTSGIIQTWTHYWVSGAGQMFSLLATTVQYVVFWSLMTALYLLLRRSLDQTALDEVYRPGLKTLAPLSVDKPRTADSKSSS